MKHFLVLLFLTSFLNTVAQSNYIPGKITTKDNKVIQGLIDYQNWKKTPNLIKFKNASSENLFSPEDIMAFEIENDKYVSKLVNLDVTEQRLDYMTKDQEVKFQEKQVFLNVLVTGNANLYEFYDGRSHFFVEKNNEVNELINRTSLVGSDISNTLIGTDTYVRTSKNYIGQLNYVMNDCDAISDLKNLDYTRKSLSKIFQQYNSCEDIVSEDQIYVKETEKVRSAFYITAGYAFSSYRIDSPVLYVKDFNGGSYSTPSFGIAYDVDLSKNLGKWSMKGEILYSFYDNEFKPKENNPNIKESTFYFKNSTVALDVLLKYSFKKENRKVIPFINIGLGYNFIVSDDNYIEYLRVGNISGNKEILDFDVDKGHFSFLGGAGVDYGRFSGELRIMVTNKVITEYGGSNSIFNAGVVVGYQVF